MFHLPGSFSAITKLMLITLVSLSPNMHVKLKLGYQNLELETLFNIYIFIFPIIPLKYILHVWHDDKKSTHQTNRTSMN